MVFLEATRMDLWVEDPGFLSWMWQSLVKSMQKGRPLEFSVQKTLRVLTQITVCFLITERLEARFRHHAKP